MCGHKSSSNKFIIFYFEKQFSLLRVKWRREKANQLKDVCWKTCVVDVIPERISLHDDHRVEVFPLM